MSKPIEISINDSKDQFFRRHILENGHIKDHLPYFQEYLDTPIDREEIAARLNLELGALLEIFNQSAPIDHNFLQFTHKNYEFSISKMEGLCDDFYGDRMGKFGQPLTLRFYLETPGTLPAEIFDLADWNFMGAGKAFFLGYSYGSVFQDVYFISGLQSDLAVRYGYLFQLKTGSTEVRRGNQVQIESTVHLGTVYKPHISELRRAFQRDWLTIFIAGIEAFVKKEQLRHWALHQFPLTKKEMAKGNILHRIYRGIPQHMQGSPLMVHTLDQQYLYYRMSTTSTSQN